MSNTEQLECMVDLETLGTGNNAVILSIGACHFYPSAESPKEDAFEVFIDPASCVELGMAMDPRTVMWWMAPGRGEARDLLMRNMENAVHIRDALHRFSAWIGRDKPVWGNGATFDNVILRNAYQLAGIECPWSFWNDRCYRTMKNQAPAVKMHRQGTHHSALWDAVSQATHLQAVVRSLTSSGD